ncbi:MAG: SIR2 family protein [Candidatus Lokiarchaeota archaeon]|nr:SIR2 family protein [Candidatus Lokiarchaeota archaeon]
MTINEDKPLSLLEKLKEITNEGFIAFCGAGISISPPSCSPSWWTLTEEILTAFFNKVPDEFNIPKDMILTDSNMQPEEVLESFAIILDERLYAAFDALDVAEPNANHIMIARLAKEGVLKACFTTNFDIYLEKALKEERVEFDLLVENREYEDYLQNTLASGKLGHKFLLCKVHGTIERPTSIVSVASAYKTAKGFSIPKAELFEQLLSQYTCLFLGYSGWDFNHLNYRRFWERVGPKVKKIVWNRLPHEEGGPAFKDIFYSCWNSFEFTEAELPSGLMQAIEQTNSLKKVFVLDLGIKIYKDVIAHFARAEVERIRFFKDWVDSFPPAHMIGLVITESHKFSKSFREMAKDSKELSEKTDAPDFNLGAKMTELSQNFNEGKLSLEEYQQKIFEFTMENAMMLIRNDYKPRIRELIKNNEFPGITDNPQIITTFLNALATTTRHFDLEESISQAVEYTNKQMLLMMQGTPEANADIILMNFELALKRPRDNRWKMYLSHMEAEKRKYLSGEINYDSFQANCTAINQKATYELMGMTIDMPQLFKKQINAAMNSNSDEEFEDQASAFSVTLTNMAGFLTDIYSQSEVYQDLLAAISQAQLPEEQRDPNKLITLEMLSQIDSIIRESFLPVIERAKSTNARLEKIVEIGILSLWIMGFQYLDPKGMERYQKAWTSGEYPFKSTPREIYKYLYSKTSSWIDFALETLPHRFIQKLCGLLVNLAEMGNEFELCKKATLRSLELTDGVVTEATPENIPGSLAGFYEKIGDKDNALKYYLICLDAIKLITQPVWTDVYIYRTALLLKERKDPQEALKIIGKFHPSYRGNASVLHMPARELAVSLARDLAVQQGYEDVKSALESILT